MATMTIWMIWVQEPSTGALWLVESWDDDSTAENTTGWEEAVQKARKEHGAENVRIVRGDVDFNVIEKAFQIPNAGTFGNYRFEEAPTT